MFWNGWYNRPSSFNFSSHLPSVLFFLSKLVIVWAASASVQEHGLSDRAKRMEDKLEWVKREIQGGLLGCTGAIFQFSVHKDTRA
jgi:hypothetical protein